MENVTNRAEHPNRKMADGETPLIHLTEGLRPSSTMIAIQKKNPKTGAYDLAEDTATYATETASHVHALLASMKDMHKGTGNMIHASVQYNLNDIAEKRYKAAGEISAKGNFNHIDSGLARTLAVNELAKNQVPTRTSTSFKA
jgi:hypothetical protein